MPQARPAPHVGELVGLSVIEPPAPLSASEPKLSVVPLLSTERAGSEALATVSGKAPPGSPRPGVLKAWIFGPVWTALYTMQKQPDGSWKISACVLVEVPGADA